MDKLLPLESAATARRVKLRILTVAHSILGVYKQAVPTAATESPPATKQQHYLPEERRKRRHALEKREENLKISHIFLVWNNVCRF